MQALQVGEHITPRQARPPLHQHAVRAQRRRLLARQVPGARRHHRDHPGLRRARDPHRDVRRRDRGALHAASADRRRAAARWMPCPSSRRRTTPPAPRPCTARSRSIKVELAEQLAVFEKQGKLLEAQRLRMRTGFDIEMMEQIGFCNGIENYSRHIDGRAPGQPPNTLLDYFAEDFLVVIDESHVTVPQIGAMYEGDASRKRTLVEHGFRLPSALDNRPLRWEEFLERVGPEGLPLGDARPLRAGHVRRRRRADHPPDRPRRPADRRQVEQGADRRPARRDPHPRREGRARARHDADQEDGGGADRLPRRGRRAGALPALRRRHPAPRRAAHRAAGRASTTCSSASTCCARGSTCPRCRSSRSSTPTRRASCARRRR